MTQLLKKAFDQASQLPPEEQDEPAKWLLEERASEKRWDEVFRASADQLRAMAKEALQEARERQTDELDPDRL